MATWKYRGDTYESDSKGNVKKVSGNSNSSSSSSRGGYGKDQNYGSRETAYTFNDGQTYYSQATRWEDAAKQAGNTSGLKSAVTYNNGTGKGVTTFGGSSGYHGSTPQNEKAYNNAMRYEQDLLDAVKNGKLGFDVGNNLSTGYYGSPDSGGGLNINPYEFGTYESPYANQIASLMNQLLNRSAFSYDYETDPIYLQYAQSYNTEGKRASQDAMAQAAALTGGLPSSYAITAANQAGNYYANALNDKIPELYLQNYNMYLDELGLDYDNLNALINLDSTDYSRWLDAEQQKYQAYRDAISDDQWNQQFEYGKTLDSYNISQNQLDREDAAKEKAQNWVFTLLKMGITPSKSELEAAGLSSDYSNNILKYYGNGESSSDSPRRLEKVPTPTVIQGKNIEEYEAAAGNYLGAKTTLDNMKEQGYSTSDMLSALNELYQAGGLNQSDYMTLYNRIRG